MPMVITRGLMKYMSKRPLALMQQAQVAIIFIAINLDPEPLRVNRRADGSKVK